MSGDTDNIVEVRALSKHFVRAPALPWGKPGDVRAVDGVSLSIPRGKTVGLVGESGSGKSVMALSILRLVPDPPGRIVGGRVAFEGTELLGLDPERMRKMRGSAISMIFQEPMTSLNPLHTIERQLRESIELHQGLRGPAVRARILELLNRVGIRDPESRLGAYPHQLSGGMRQRLMIALALVLLVPATATWLPKFRVSP